MKTFRKILEDIRKRQNLDVYLTILGAIGVSILGFAQVADLSIISPAILMVLALVSFSIVTNRHENENLQIALQNLDEIKEDFETIKLNLSTTFSIVPIIENGDEKGLRKTRELITKASQEILILDYNPVENDTGKLRHNLYNRTSEERVKYYSAILDKVSSKAGKFRYRRILQIPKGKKLENVFSDDPVFREHCEKLVTMGDKQPEIASLKVCSPVYEGTFIIIDRKYVTFNLDIIDPDNNCYTDGDYFFFDDPSGKIAKRFLQFFERADTSAIRVRISDFQK